MPNSENHERALGRLEAGLQAVMESQKTILDGQNEIRREMEEHRQSTDGRFRRSETETSKTFSAIHGTLARLADTHISESKEFRMRQASQGERIASIEARLSAYEIKVRDSERDTRRDWRRLKQAGAALGASATLVAGDHATGGKVMKFLSALFTGKAG